MKKILNQLPIQQQKLFQTIWQLRIASAQQLGSILELSMPTINTALKSLEQKGLVIAETGESSGGRKPQLYRILENLFYSVGVTIDPEDGIDIVLVDVNLIIIKQDHLPLYKNDAPDKVLRSIAKKIDNLIEQLPLQIPKKHILGIGVGSVGPIDTQAGVFLSGPRFPIPGWENIALAETLNRYSSLPVMLNNLARLSLLSQKEIGLAKEHSNVAYVYLHHGVGLGTLIDNQIVDKTYDMTGALNHMIIAYNQNAPFCEICGHQGCLQVHLSEKNLLNRFEQLKAKSQHSRELIKESDDLIKSLDVPNFLAVMDNKGPIGALVVEEALRHLGLALSNLLNLGIFDLLIIGGESIASSNRLFESIKTHAESTLLKHTKQVVKIMRDDSEPKSALIGTALQVFLKNIIG